MFGTLLIANRGEIACRVIRTARRLGIRTVAVYSEADRNAQHVKLADEALPIGRAAARDSYLKIDAIIDAAKQAKADAIHPGYGFLSENAGFAEACAAAKIVFVGPPAQAIRAMGDKSAAKALMEKAGVPVVPGYHGAAQDLKTFSAAAKKIGYPVMIKAAAGGGGRGMRVVETEAGLAEAIEGARREAASAFGDDRLLVEKYIVRPRHIEVQVFADSKGNALHLFERDCSIQRRHQKVLEEAPAPGMTRTRRAEMGEAAVKAACAVGYCGAGTIEFIADRSGAFYFMEMNTRLQVEHPVTEAITGLDLVEWQLIVANGGKLPRRQEDLTLNGHAIEVRLYAEDPRRGFLPSSGKLHHLSFLSSDTSVRVDAGFVTGDTVSIHYDPLIAKLIVHGPDRGAAVQRLRDALAQCAIVGPATNLGFLSTLAAHPAFAAADIDTGFIGRHMDQLVPAPQPAGDRVLAIAALAVMLQQREDTAAESRRSGDPFSPWGAMNGWRLGEDARHVLRLRDPARADPIALTVHLRRRDFGIDLPGGAVAARGTLGPDGRLSAEIDRTALGATIVRRGDELTVFHDGASHVLTLVNPMADMDAKAADTGRLTAPMPGKIVAVRVEAGAKVKRGTPLLVLEAMKMEHTIAAPADGTVERVCFAAGAQVNEGAELVVFKPADGA
jgi:3-methylcrotonyl-CoA carboxylase alpha subunit